MADDTQNFKDLRAELIDLISKNTKAYARMLPKHKLWPWIAPFPGETAGEKAYNARTYDSYEEAHIAYNNRACLTCGLKFNKFLNGSYKIFCSQSCSSKHGAKSEKNIARLKSDEFKKKRSATLIKAYGTDNMYEAFAEQRRAATQASLGVDYALQSKAVLKKRDETVKEKYGVDNVFQVDFVKEKIANTMKLRYGSKHALQVGEFKQKYKETMLRRYDSTSVFGSHILYSKIIQTNMLLYGVENVQQRTDIKERSAKTRRLKQIESGFYDSKMTRIMDTFGVTPLFSKEEYVDGCKHTWKHTCGNVYESHWGINGYITPCPEVNCRRQSIPQRDVYDFLRDVLGQDEIIDINTRAIISPKELDLYLPARSLAIEMDGVYWHQHETEPDLKLKRCNALDVTLIHITDISWQQKKPIWKSIILSKLGLTDRIYARKCKVVELTSAEQKVFFTENHFQGYQPGRVAYGLKYGEIIVAAALFAIPRYNAIADWELLRYANLLNTTVVGGMSKLISAFVNDHKPNAIVSYAKKEYSEGNCYKQIGFVLESEGEPGYSYYKDGRLINRLNAQKHKLPALLKDLFNENLSELDNMVNAGYMKINDRGSMTFIKRYS